MLKWCGVALGTTANSMVKLELGSAGGFPLWNCTRHSEQKALSFCNRKATWTVTMIFPDSQPIAQPGSWIIKELVSGFEGSWTNNAQPCSIHHQVPCSHLSSCPPTCILLTYVFFPHRFTSHPTTCLTDPFTSCSPFDNGSGWCMCPEVYPSWPPGVLLPLCITYMPFTERTAKGVLLSGRDEVAMQVKGSAAVGLGRSLGPWQLLPSHSMLLTGLVFRWGAHFISCENFSGLLAHIQAGRRFKTETAARPTVWLHF